MGSKKAAAGSANLGACPQGHTGGGYTTVKKGLRRGADGTRQRVLCQGPDGVSHGFSYVVDDAKGLDKRKKGHGVLCPSAGHRDGKVRAKGTVTTSTGTWGRYLCVRPTGSKHYFRVLVSADGAVLTSMEKPPDCREHSASKVVRHGKYGKGKTQRQRYRCEPNDGEPVHYFTPPLSREAVSLGSSCSTCDDLLSPHRGALTAARHTPWTLRGIVQALNDLSLGTSYAAASLALRAQRDEAWDHLRSAHGVEMTMTDTPVASTSESWNTRQGKGAWHLAADLVEQYAPLLFDVVTSRLVAEEEALRAANDAALTKEPDAALAHPLVYILDELPVEFRKSTSNRGRFQQNSWSLLAVVELRWHASDDPFALPRREARLRLARAYPRGNADAWRLVLDELPVRPDFVVADASEAIKNAVNSHYGQGAVGSIPSFFHIQRNIRATLLKLPGATTSEQGRTVLVGQLRKQMELLTRSELMGFGPGDVATWWDDLIAIVAAIPAPTSGLVEQRRIHEPRMTAALPLLQKNPQLPASNAAVESRIRLTLEPFLDNRKHRYRNLARTNFLFDLAVCRAQGLFTDLDAIAKLIRENNEAANGWAPTPRQLADTQPALPAGVNGQAAPVYSSLLNPLLLPVLAKQRNVPVATSNTTDKTVSRPPRKATPKPSGRTGRKSTGRPKRSKTRSKDELA